MLVMARVPLAIRSGLSDVTVYCPDGSAITIRVLSSDRGTVRLGVTAPKTHEIYREEIDPHGRPEEVRPAAHPDRSAA